jgi:hypothetical protein
MIIKKKNVIWVALFCVVVLGACIYVKGNDDGSESTNKGTEVPKKKK